MLLADHFSAQYSRQFSAQYIQYINDFASELRDQNNTTVL